MVLVLLLVLFSGCCCCCDDDFHLSLLRSALTFSDAALRKFTLSDETLLLLPLFLSFPDDVDFFNDFDFDVRFDIDDDNLKMASSDIWDEDDDEDLGTCVLCESIFPLIFLSATKNALLNAFDD